MVRTNGSTFFNDNEPPPSSMLATHVRPGAKVPHLNQQNFAQLLDESLGQDENGRPNLGDDAVLNQKVIMVVVQVGIDPLLVAEKDNPFRSTRSIGRDTSQLHQCLAVLHLAITRSRHLFHQDVVTEVLDAPRLPLYSAVIPKLLSLAARYQDVDITKGVFNVISAGLHDEKRHDTDVVSALRDFVYACFTGFLYTAKASTWQSLDEKVLFDNSTFVLPQSTCQEIYASFKDQLRISTIGQLLFVTCQLATFLSRHGSTKLDILRLKKQSQSLQVIVDDLHDRLEERDEVESLRAEVGSLYLVQQPDTESFSTLADTEEWPDSERAHKRPRLSTDNNQGLLQQTSTIEQIAMDLSINLTGQAASDMIGIKTAVLATFPALSDNKQCSSLDQLGAAACRFAAMDVEDDFLCCICDDTQLQHDGKVESEDHIIELLNTVLALQRYAEENPQVHISALRALRKILSHINSYEIVKFKGSAAGSWCLKSMRSSSREIKLCTIQVFQAFIHDKAGRDRSLVRQNRVTVLEILQSWWKEGQPASQEAVVVALSQVARIGGDEEMNIILLRLVDYLGHQNAYISALVYSELQQLAQYLQVPMAMLFRPFWRTLSVVIVQNLIKRPVIAQQVCDLLAMKVDGLLQMTEEHILPYLVLSRDRTTLNRICTSSNSPATPFDLCTRQVNFPRILALLMAQAFPEPEQTTMKLLINVSEDFRDQDLAGWIHLYPVDVACELLKLAADAGRGKASKVYQGFQLLAQLQFRRSGSSSASSRQGASTASFLEGNALAVVTHFTVKLNDTSFREPSVEKRRYLIALGEFIKLGKGYVSVALPHICACLRAAMNDEFLCNTAFDTWCDMIMNIDDEEIGELINQTFAIIVRHWLALESAMQDRAYHLIAHLLKDHEALIRDTYGTIPSLANIPMMSKFESELTRLKKQRDERNQLMAFVTRLKDENLIVVEQALVELSAVLREKQDFVQKAILREQSDVVIADLTRGILDACVKFKSSHSLLLHGGQCLGAIGCLDPSKVESIRERKGFVVLSNFAEGNETVGFLMFFMEQILVKDYVSTSNLREKGFLAWALQRLLQICEFSSDITSRARVGGLSGKDRQWFELSDNTRLILTPFLTSRFTSLGKRPRAHIQYPYFKHTMTYKTWLTEVTLDFLNRGSGANVDMIFDICCRLVVQGQGTSIASFLLPYVALNTLLTGTEQDKADLVGEMSWVLQQSVNGRNSDVQDSIRQCSQTIFDILDYMSVWLQDTRKQAASARARIQRGIKDPALDRILAQNDIVESVIVLIPPQLITQKAMECKSFARALFHQEQYVTTKAEPSDDDFRRLQDIYAQIDEPDGIEGFSAVMKFLDVESEVMQHKKAGRWTAAQSWYEMQLTESPENTEVQVNLLKCLKESGQHDVLMHHFDSIASRSTQIHQNILPFAVEAAWVTDRWDKLATYLVSAPQSDFIVNVGNVMLALKQKDGSKAKAILDQVFQSTTSELTTNSTVSFQSSHESLLKVHILDDIRIMLEGAEFHKDINLPRLKKRLDILGSNVGDKQFILGIQRAMMHLLPEFSKDEDIATSWMTSARLARKAQATQQAFNAVLRASTLGDKSAAIEQAKLMWQEGDHRKAIQTLEGAIDSGAFGSYIQNPNPDAMTVDSLAQEERNDMNAKAFVLLGKWLDQAGQTQSEVIIKTFRKSTEQNRRWEKGWYNLGRHYNKILESEKLKPPGKESQPFLTGEAAKLVIDNFLRALVSGNKYLFQTLPKVLTLWLELVGSEIEHDARRGNSQFHQHNKTQRKKVVEDTNATIKKYLERIQPYALYTILPQLVARICHPDQQVNNLLQMMIVKVVRSFPQQALWTVLATVKSASKDRATRGLNLLRKAAENAKKDLKVFNASEMRDFITSSQKFSDEVLRIADFHIENRPNRVNLAKDFGFNHKIAPSKLVVPSEACLIPSIPSNNELQLNKSFRAFAKEPVTISAFLDEARVLPSLQKPRKLSLRGSDGKIYSVLAKPHDDLRKDQRLMEFNTMINRFLKHDIDAAKRRLYIKTYAVIPLNEECGLIEWVDGLTTMRDILLKLYDQRGIKPDYNAVREALDKIVTRSEDKAKDFVDQVQSRFPPILRQWFIENFPDPTAWFNARMRYTRTSAVMSMVGHVLGLGDRHGENILFEEGTGGILHVDFNCLFDKGLTFEKPECVPFRLTHNMRNAMGSYKHEGPFRHCCEITTNLLRNNEDALMTILETFLHDPTTDFQTAGKKRKPAGGYAAGVEVPDTPERMLEGVKGKLRGMLPGESVPLSVGGYVDYMIRQAKDEANLARMYIGWCAFF